jgi:hypothetical protein
VSPGYLYRASDQWMLYGGTAGSATSDGDPGTYTVIGNTLVFKRNEGPARRDFQSGDGQLLAAGKLYLRQ